MRYSKPAREVTSRKVLSRLKIFRLPSMPKGVLKAKGRFAATFRSWVAFCRLRQLSAMASPRRRAFRSRRSISPVSCTRPVTASGCNPSTPLMLLAFLVSRKRKSLVLSGVNCT